MSNHSYRKPKPHESHTGLAIAVTILIVVLIYFLNFGSRHNPHANWHVSPAQVLETRITLQGTRDAAEARPAEIYYQGEAHVTYTADSKQYDQWLPATNTIADRAWLAFYMSQHSTKTAEVKWNPANPSQAVVILHAP
jgi:hypothetical protein